MDNINAEFNSYREAVKCQEKSSSRDLVIMANLDLRKETIWQGFIDIWHHPRDNTTCMILLSHIRQYYARLPGHFFTFCLENQTAGSYSRNT